MNDSGPTGREFDMLRVQVDRLGSRIESMDEHGTRGVVVLAAQFGELAKDLGAHLEQHSRAEDARASSRRILVGTISTLLLGNFSVLGWVIAHVH